MLFENNPKTFSIKYKTENDTEWQTLKIESSFFRRTDTYCEEWYAMEIKELFMAKLNVDEEDFYDVIKFQGNFWDNVVMPIYNHFQEKEEA